MNIDPNRDCRGHFVVKSEAFSERVIEVTICIALYPIVQDKRSTDPSALAILLGFANKMQSLQPVYISFKYRDVSHKRIEEMMHICFIDNARVLID